MNRVRYVLSFVCFLSISLVCYGQPSDSTSRNDSTRQKHHRVSTYRVDSLGRRLHDPRIATLRSTFVPGWGQIYNHKYWKLPIVYAAIGIPAYTYVYNRKGYNNYQKAISIVDRYSSQGAPAVPDSVLNTLSGEVRNLVVLGYNQESLLRTYRNEFRKDEDYSVLFFLLFWGLNIVDATVDAHLMYFDVSDKLTMHVQQPSPGFAAPGGAGLSLVFDIHKARSRPLPTR
ncbi:MAG TPA: DUF5683 domain-containing protein [Puia sp.]|nr:DUF5683 domain-containing protein [Puia sp.]